MIMKRIVFLLFVITAWFSIPNVSFAQSPNYSINLSIGNFQYVDNVNGILLEWRLPRDIGDSYEGQTAREMIEYSIQGYSSNIMLYGFGASRADENYLYGFARLAYGGSSPFTITLTGLNPFSSNNTIYTKVIEYNP